MENAAAAAFLARPPADENRDEHLGSDRSRVDLGDLALGLPYVFVAFLCLFLLPAGRPFEPVGVVAVLLFIATSQFELRLRVGWVGCQQAAFVLMLFALPLNTVPVVACGSFMVAQMFKRHSFRELTSNLGNNWYVIPPVLVLAAAAPGPAMWVHWPIYAVAFACQFAADEGMFTARCALRGKRIRFREELVPVAVDTMLVPIGLMAAVNARSVPVATVAMLAGVTGLLALLGREHVERRAQTERALRDPLTGLPNRALFAESLDACEQRCEREGQQAGMLLLDLDGFKQVNDTFGHRQGDEVLSAFADRLRWSTRGTDTAARLGGDEFAIVLAEPVRQESVDAVVAKLRAALAEPVSLSSGETLVIEASIGAAMFGEGTSANEAMEQADLRLYEQKRARKR